MLLWVSFSSQKPRKLIPAIDFHHSKDTEGDGDGGLECSKTRVECFRELVGDDVVACPEDACAGHQWEDATNQEYCNRALPPY